MREKRLEAYALYESLPMPHTTKDDVWRRTVDMRTQDYWRRSRRSAPRLRVWKNIIQMRQQTGNYRQKI